MRTHSAVPSPFLLELLSLPRIHFWAFCVLLCHQPVLLRPLSYLHLHLLPLHLPLLIPLQLHLWQLNLPLLILLPLHLPLLVYLLWHLVLLQGNFQAVPAFWALAFLVYVLAQLLAV
jgi:hypothetical protein